MNGVLKEVSKILSTLPNLGPRTANKIAVTLAHEKDNLTEALIQILKKLQVNIKNCSVCNNLCEGELCYICDDYSRDHNQICVVSDALNMWAIEKIGQYEGVYHILGGELSITQCIVPTELNFDGLLDRITQDNQTKEIIIAMNPTITGQATCAYLKEILAKVDDIVISTLSLGMPMGSCLDYLDTGTIAMAMASRREV